MRFQAKWSLLRFAFEKWICIFCKPIQLVSFVHPHEYNCENECGYKHCQWSLESNAYLNGIVLENGTSLKALVGDSEKQFDCD